MRLSPEALIKIVDIFRSALVEGRDASQQLRDLELSVEEPDGTLHNVNEMADAKLVLSAD